MQSRPRVLVGFPHDFAERLARVLQRHHEQLRPAVLAVRVARERALAEVHLRLFSGQALQYVEALGLARLQNAHEALHRVVPMGEAAAFHQVLVDALRVAAELDLTADPLPVRFARRAGLFGRPGRWPGWRSFNRGNRGFSRENAGGHPGGIWCHGLDRRLRVPADRLAINARTRSISRWLRPDCSSV